MRILCGFFNNTGELCIAFFFSSAFLLENSIFCQPNQFAAKNGLFCSKFYQVQLTTSSLRNCAAGLRLFILIAEKINLVSPKNKHTFMQFRNVSRLLSKRKQPVNPCFPNRLKFYIPLTCSHAILLIVSSENLMVHKDSIPLLIIFFIYFLSF